MIIISLYSCPDIPTSLYNTYLVSFSFSQAVRLHDVICECQVAIGVKTHSNSNLYSYAFHELLSSNLLSDYDHIDCHLPLGSIITVLCLLSRVLPSRQYLYLASSLRILVHFLASQQEQQPKDHIQRQLHPS